MAVAALYILATIKTSQGTANAGSFDRLAVNNTGTGLGISTGFEASGLM
jgi:hypothetical protein